MRMISGSRRVLLYWVLMLLPTLAVGGGVLWLLSREQARLQAQTRAATEARHAAVGARARLIAENVELLVGDVQAGLMTTLREVPEGGARDGFLNDWKKSNPLVRETFVVAGGRIVKADAGTVSPWLSRLVEAGPPWAWKSVAQLDTSNRGLTQQMFLSANNTGAAGNNGAASGNNTYAVQSSVSNSMQVNSARYNLQEQSKLKNGDVQVARTGWLPWREGAKLHMIGWRELRDGAIVGVEVQLKQVAAGLGDVLPEGREPGEVYELREIGGATYQQKTLSETERVVADKTPLITVPISEAVLPGWEVVGYLAETSKRMSDGVFFILSGVLAGVLVAAILAGGTLLLRQARLSEEEAAQKTSFVANVSHELKTPLTTIRLYAELLEQGRVTDESKRIEYLGTIGRETQRLARLVNNVLGFSRLEQGTKRFDVRELDLAGEINRLLDTHAPRLIECGMSLRREVPDGPLSVRADRDALEQILINLLDNACKYASAGGEVSVTVAASAKGGAEVRVADRGPGVPMAHRSRIFDKFHRVDATLTAAQGGAGLGLSIARQLARGQGGELRYAERAGGGAEFIFELPLSLS